jgi:hypothetical protein
MKKETPLSVVAAAGSPADGVLVAAAHCYQLPVAAAECKPRVPAARSRCRSTQYNGYHAAMCSLPDTVCKDCGTAALFDIKDLLL